jgi:hypothetical protein
MFCDGEGEKGQHANIKDPTVEAFIKRFRLPPPNTHFE